MDTDLLTNSVTGAWWVLAGGDLTTTTATNAARVGVNIEFQNGQQAILIGKGLFTMHRPSVTFAAQGTPGGRYYGGFPNEVRLNNGFMLFRTQITSYRGRSRILAYYPGAIYHVMNRGDRRAIASEYAQTV